MGKACAPGAAGPRAWKLVKTAVTGHSRWSTNRGRQIYIQNSLSGLVWFAPFGMDSIRAPVGRDMKAVPS